MATVKLVDIRLKFNSNQNQQIKHLKISFRRFFFRGIFLVEQVTDIRGCRILQGIHSPELQNLSPPCRRRASCVTAVWIIAHLNKPGSFI